MLAKLLKYENKALSKILFPLGFGVLLVSLFASLMLKLSFSVSYWLQDHPGIANIIQPMAAMLFTFSVIAIISACFVCFFILMQRYYKNLFSDEGYLTFTLPVKVSRILLSKLFAGVLWSLFLTVCTVVGVFIIALFGTSRSLINAEVLKGLRLAWETIVRFNALDIQLPLIILQYVLLILASLLQQFLLIYLAITLGNQVAKKHKVLASIGMYFVIYAICQTINMFLVIVFGLGAGGIAVLNAIAPTSALFHWALLFITLLSLAYSLVFFFINHYILKNKLNLE